MVVVEAREPMTHHNWPLRSLALRIANIRFNHGFQYLSILMPPINL